MPTLRTKIFLLFFCFLTIYSCRHSPKLKNKSVGFYYWKTVFHLSEQELAYADSIHASKIYLRLFDVDSDTDVNGIIKNIPVSIVQLEDSVPKNIELVPVIYITRNALAQENNIDSLAIHIASLVTKLTTKNNWHFSEIQWDMDWTPSTRIKYFELLNKLKKNSVLKRKIFSATIRLHQIKYKSKCGIPPVDKGLLMCYNMGNLKEYGNKNSILDVALCKEYLSDMDSYPLKLDIALPLFYWGVLFRDKNFAGIIKDVSLTDLENNPTFEKQNNSLFKAKKDTYLNQISIRMNDEMRVEEVSVNDLIRTSNFLHDHLNTDSLNVLFYHLDDSIINKYSNSELQKILDSF